FARAGGLQLSRAKSLRSGRSRHAPSGSAKPCRFARRDAYARLPRPLREDAWPLPSRSPARRAAFSRPAFLAARKTETHADASARSPPRARAYFETWLLSRSETPRSDRRQTRSPAATVESRRRSA